MLFSSISICAKYKFVLPYITGTRGITTPLFNLLFTSLFSIKFLYFFIISSLFTYFNLFVSIFMQSYANINLQMYMFRSYIYSYPGLHIHVYWLLYIYKSTILFVIICFFFWHDLTFTLFVKLIYHIGLDR